MVGVACGLARSSCAGAVVNRWRDPAVAASAEACAAIVKREARNFYYGLKLAPEPQRSALYAVYAWMRRADDLVDDARGECLPQVESFREETTLAFNGRVPRGHAMWPALVAAIETYRIDHADFHGMLDGQLLDARHRPVATWDELRHFCDLVAGTVGRTCTRVFGANDARAMEWSTQRGIAFQLTNILRDVREDAQRGRSYVPAEELSAAAIDLPVLLSWSDPARCHAFVGGQVQRCLEHYRLSAPLEAAIAPGCRPTLWAMTQIYRGIALKIQSTPRAIVQGRVSLPAASKWLIAARARWGMSASRVVGGR